MMQPSKYQDPEPTFNKNPDPEPTVEKKKRIQICPAKNGLRIQPLKNLNPDQYQDLTERASVFSSENKSRPNFEGWIRIRHSRKNPVPTLL